MYSITNKPKFGSSSNTDCDAICNLLLHQPVDVICSFILYQAVSWYTEACFILHYKLHLMLTK